MGLLDAILGRRKLPKPAADRIFAMSTAAVTLEVDMGLTSAGAAAIVFKALPTADFDRIAADMEEVVRGAGADTGTSVERSEDSYGYRWMILRDPDVEDLVVGVHGVSSALESSGYGDRLLCALFSFQDAEGQRVYWIYNYKRGRFYPFVPAGGDQQRDSERELRLQAQIGNELPIDEDIERWFPLWDVPL